MFQTGGIYTSQVWYGMYEVSMYVATETPPVPHRTAGGFYKSAGLCQNAAMCGCLNWLVDLFKGGALYVCGYGAGCFV